MTDDEFLRALEDCTLPATQFGHVGHVRAAYLLLRRTGFAEALPRICRSISRYAAHQGQPDRYQETMTVAYASLIQRHLTERGDGGDWTGFARQNPELFDSRTRIAIDPAFARGHGEPAVSP